MRKGAPQVNRICRQCSAVETPLWRAGPAGPKTLCNACGVRWKKGKLVLNECAQGLKPINDAEVAASLTRAASAKAKSPVGTSRKRGGRQTQSNPPVNRRTKATPMEKSLQDGPKETKPSPPSFWTSPASSPVSKEPSPVPEEEGKKLVESEPASVDLSCALEHFQLADDNLERCGSEMLDDMDDFNQKIGAQAYIDPMSTIPISPATSSICPESPPSSILTSPLSSDNGKDSLNKLRSAVYDPQNSIAKPYKECVMQLGQLCMNLSTEERTKYVRAFANDQCLTLNPCGLSIAEIQRHDIVLEGFFRNEVAFGHALCAYREAYSSLELLDFGSNAFVDMLVEDVSRVVPALQRSNMKLVAAE